MSLPVLREFLKLPLSSTITAAGFDYDRDELKIIVDDECIPKRPESFAICEIYPLYHTDVETKETEFQSYDISWPKTYNEGYTDGLHDAKNKSVR